MVHVAVLTTPFASVTCDVNVYVPAVVGVPETTPVLAFSVRPGGNEPEEIEYVYGAVPPEVDNVSE
jgi:hypothetical protein